MALKSKLTKGEIASMSSLVLVVTVIVVMPLVKDCRNNDMPAYVTDRCDSLTVVVETARLQNADTAISVGKSKKSSKTSVPKQPRNPHGRNYLDE